MNSNERPETEASISDNRARAETMRRDFETWIAGPPYEKKLDRFGEGEEVSWFGQYTDIAVQLAWEAWQESATIFA